MSRRTSVRSGNVVDQEVANLMSLQNKAQYTNALLSLRQRYKDEDLVKKIEDVFALRHSAIVKSAKKFADAVKAKYANQNVPFHQLLMKARAHAKKHRLSEEEFSEFQRIYEQELAGGNSAEVLIPVTNLMKVLGNVNQGSDSYFNVDSNDMRNLQEILKLHDASKQLHAQVLLQALQYIDKAAPAIPRHVLGASYVPQLQSPTDYVHPVVAALFVPQFKTVDEHFLYSNMAGIVKARYNRQPLRTRADYELFYNLVTDPNDVVCDTHSPVGDLLNRCNLQTQLWNSVLHLRNGQCFNPSLREFMSAVDVCRLNKFDNPDFVYGRHDGTVIKRLFSAFSFRPTVVSTLPIGQLFSYNPYFQNLRPLVTSIPMINVRLLQTVNAAGQPSTPSLKHSLSQTQKFIEGNMFIDRATNVMFSREIIVFFVDRRSFSYTLNTTPVNVLRLPSSVSGFEIVNNKTIGVPGEIELNDKTKFGLASAVLVDTKSGLDPNNKNALHVISSSTLICQRGPTSPMAYHHYKPAAVTKGGKLFEDNITDSTKLLSEQGVIYIYKNAAYEPTTPYFSM
jgi:hypothetical protein